MTAEDDGSAMKLKQINERLKAFEAKLGAELPEEPEEEGQSNKEDKGGIPPRGFNKLIGCGG